MSACSRGVAPDVEQGESVDEPAVHAREPIEHVASIVVPCADGRPCIAARVQAEGTPRRADEALVGVDVDVRGMGHREERTRSRKSTSSSSLVTRSS